MKGKAAVFFKVLSMFTVILLVAFSATSCIRIAGIRGSGDVSSEERNIAGVDSVSVGSGINLYIDQNGTETLRIEAEDNILPLIVTEVENGHLKIDYKITLFRGLSLTKPVNIYLTVKEVNRVGISSGSTLRSENLKTDSLKLDLSSGAEGKITVDTNELEIRLSSGSRLTVSGKTADQEVDLSSGTVYEAEELSSRTAVLEVSSGATATVNVSENLDVDISSGGIVRYSGSPQIISDISSGGSLQSKQ